MQLPQNGDCDHGCVYSTVAADGTGIGMTAHKSPENSALYVDSISLARWQLNMTPVFSWAALVLVIFGTVTLHRCDSELEKDGGEWAGLWVGQWAA